MSDDEIRSMAELVFRTLADGGFPVGQIDRLRFWHLPHRLREIDYNFYSEYTTLGLVDQMAVWGVLAETARDSRAMQEAMR